jgi:hypothetical protein
LTPSGAAFGEEEDFEVFTAFFLATAFFFAGLATFFLATFFAGFVRAADRDRLFFAAEPVFFALFFAIRLPPLSSSA